MVGMEHMVAMERGSYGSYEIMEFMLVWVKGNFARPFPYNRLALGLPFTGAVHET